MSNDEKFAPDPLRLSEETPYSTHELATPPYSGVTASTIPTKPSFKLHFIVRILKMLYPKNNVSYQIIEAAIYFRVDTPSKHGIFVTPSKQIF